MDTNDERVGAHALYEIEQLVATELSKPAFSGTREEMLAVLCKVEETARVAIARIR